MLSHVVLQLYVLCCVDDRRERECAIYSCLPLPHCFLGGELVAATSEKVISIHMSDQNRSNLLLSECWHLWDMGRSMFFVDVDATFISGTFSLLVVCSRIEQLTRAHAHLWLHLLLFILWLMLLQPIPFFLLFVILIHWQGVVYLWVKWVMGLPSNPTPSWRVRVHCVMASLSEVSQWADWYSQIIGWWASSYHTIPSISICLTLLMGTITLGISNPYTALDQCQKNHRSSMYLGWSSHLHCKSIPCVIQSTETHLALAKLHGWCLACQQSSAGDTGWDIQVRGIWLPSPWWGICSGCSR